VDEEDEEARGGRGGTRNGGHESRRQQRRCGQGDGDGMGTAVPRAVERETRVPQDTRDAAVVVTEGVWAVSPPCARTVLVCASRALRLAQRHVCGMCVAHAILEREAPWRLALVFDAPGGGAFDAPGGGAFDAPGGGVGRSQPQEHRLAARGRWWLAVIYVPKLER